MTIGRVINLGFAPTSVFSFTASPLELMLSGSMMYWFLFVAFRFILNRDVGSLAISDFLFVVILGDAAQNGIIGRPRRRQTAWCSLRPWSSGAT